ncbi:MAG: hypothetical protein COA78_26810 [Blastopirellula sp.]|nr:MAG: hypothetical protein COA78_26810 [Blastopirellula sp.]
MIANCIKCFILALLILQMNHALAQELIDKEKLAEEYDELANKIQRSFILQHWSSAKSSLISMEKFLIENGETIATPMSLREVRHRLKDAEKGINFNPEDSQSASKIIELFAGVDKNCFIGEFDQALQLSKQANKLSFELFGEESYTTICSSFKLGLTYCELANYDKAMSVFNRCRVLAIAHAGKKSTLFIHAYDLEIYVSNLKEEYSNSIVMAKELLSTIESHKLQISEKYIPLNLQLATLQNMASDCDSALVYAKKGLAAIEKFGSPSASIHLGLIHEYAEAQAKLKNFEPAAGAYFYLLEESKKLPNFPADLWVEYLGEYTSVLRNLGKVEEAKKLEREAEQILLSLEKQKSRS